MRWIRLAGVFVSTVAVAATALCVVPGLFGGPSPVVVESGSMAPSIRPGDVVLVSPPEGPVDPGTIVTFDGDDGRGRVTHRVVAFEDGRYVTRGDANTTDDSSPVSPERVEGTAAFVVPVIGRPLVWWSEGDWAPLVAVLVVMVAAVGAAVAPQPHVVAPS